MMSEGRRRELEQIAQYAREHRNSLANFKSEMKAVSPACSSKRVWAEDDQLTWSVCVAILLAAAPGVGQHLRQHCQQTRHRPGVPLRCDLTPDQPAWWWQAACLLTLGLSLIDGRPHGHQDGPHLALCGQPTSRQQQHRQARHHRQQQAAADGFIPAAVLGHPRSHQRTGGGSAAASGAAAP